MTHQFTRDSAVLIGHVTVEDAATLLEWMLETPKGELDLRDVTHLHAAALQAIACAANRIAEPPRDAFCATALSRLGRL